MKTKYLMPEIQVHTVPDWDVVRTSPVQLGLGEWGMEDNFD